MNDAISGTQDRVAVEVRAGVMRPDWSAVTSEAAGEALRARDAARSNLVESWAVALGNEEDHVWRRVITSFVEYGRAPRLEELTIDSGLDRNTIIKILGGLHERDLLGLSNSFEVLHAYPFTTRETEHVVQFGAHKLHALCAIDALGAGAMCERDVLVESRCRSCATPIRIRTAGHGEALSSVSPPGTVIWHDVSYAGSAAASCCARIAFFCSDEHLTGSLDSVSSRRGRRLSADEALQVGKAIFGPVLKQPAQLAEA